MGTLAWYWSISRLVLGYPSPDAVSDRVRLDRFGAQQAGTNSGASFAESFIADDDRDLAALIDTDLGDLIGHQVNAFNARTRMDVAYEKTGAVDPPPEVMEVFYRTAQEALNNINKHAAASQVSIDLFRKRGHVRLVISDDGLGFDPEQVFSKHLGLRIMAERADQVGAELKIASHIQQGTRVQLSWKPTTKENKDG